MNISNLMLNYNVDIKNIFILLLLLNLQRLNKLFGSMELKYDCGVYTSLHLLY